MTTTALNLAADCGTDAHGNTRASQDTRAHRACRVANDQIARAYYEGADRTAPEDMAQARASLDTARAYRDLIATADLDGREDATPTTWADLAEEAAGRAYDAATDAIDA
jgi:hypothetical protein